MHSKLVEDNLEGESQQLILRNFSNYYTLEELTELEDMIEDQHRNCLTKIYQAIIYTLNRGDLAKRIMLYPFFTLKNINSIEYQLLGLHSNMPIWPASTAIPLQSPVIPMLVNAMVDGARFVTDKLWPGALFGLISYDFYSYYKTPENRYGNTPLKILSGLFTNQGTLSSHFGSGMVKDARDYWLWLSIVTTTPFLAAIGYSIIHLPWLKPIKVSRTTSALNMQPGFCEDVLLWSFPLHEISYQLRRAEYALYYDSRLSSSKRKELLYSIIELAKRHDKITQWVAMEVLANLAGIFREEGLAKIKNHYQAALKKSQQIGLNKNIGVSQWLEEFDDFRQNLRELRQESLATLKELSAYNGNGITLRPLMRYLHAHYLLWTLGEEENPAFHLVFLPPALLLFAYAWYAKIRFVETWVQKLVNWIQVKVNEKNCQAEGNIWQFNSDVADYQCDICPDWTFVFRSEINSTQGCLNGLMAQSRNATELMSFIRRLLKPPFFDNLDMSQQDWIRWTEPAWDAWLMQLQNSSMSGLNVLNLSRPKPSSLRPQQGKIRRLVDFMQVKSIRKLDLRNQGLGSDEVKILFHNLPDSCEYIDLTNNAFGPEAAIEIGRALPHLKQLKVLKLGTNELGDDGLIALSPGFMNGTLVEVDLSHNHFGKRGIQALAQILPNTTLSSINISGNDFSSADMRQWGQALVLSKIETLFMADTRLSSSHIAVWTPYIAKSHFTTIDVSHNSFGDQGSITLLMSMRNSTVAHLSLGYNRVTDRSTLTFKLYLNATNLNSLDLSGNQFTTKGLTNIGKGLDGSVIQKLIIADMALGDDAIIAFSNQLQNVTHNLRRIDVSNNELTSAGGLALVSTMGSNTIGFILKQNQLGDEVAHELASILQNNSTLEELDLSDNLITEQGGIVLAGALRHAKNLKKLQLNGNRLGNQVGLKIAQELITIGPYSAILGEKILTYDELRAIAMTEPQMQIEELGLDDTEISTEAARALCRTQSHTKISPPLLMLQNNPIDPQEVDIGTCHINTLAVPRFNPADNSVLNGNLTQVRVMPRRVYMRTQELSLLGMLLPFVGGIILIYLLIKLFRPVATSFSTGLYNFFRSEQRLPNQELLFDTNNKNQNDSQKVQQANLVGGDQAQLNHTL